MIGQSVGKSYAYILGVFLGDGCVTKSPDGYWVFRLNTIDAEFAEATRRALKELSERPVNICTHAVSKSSKPNHSLRFGDQALCERLRSETNCKQQIPPYVADLPREERVSFIAGLMDSEGFVGKVKRPDRARPSNRDYYLGFKSCDPWVPEFIRILQNVGVRIGRVGVERPRKEGYKTPMRFTIKMQSWIDAGCYFNIRRKADRVTEWASSGAYEHRAKSPRRLASETTRQTPQPEAMI